ncbi:MAG: hypothetical protein B6D45_04325 [Ignavibacteriales bacterium UTCHB3]|nr:MAG: hypothetical protein B6D45_04325 [Ignavibacteriales bacterium UTCHB3]
MIYIFFVDYTLLTKHQNRICKLQFTAVHKLPNEGRPKGKCEKDFEGSERKKGNLFERSELFPF